MNITIVLYVRTRLHASYLNVVVTWESITPFGVALAHGTYPRTALRVEEARRAHIVTR